jgi:hypothetical protein
MIRVAELQGNFVDKLLESVRPDTGIGRREGAIAQTQMSVRRYRKRSLVA